MRIAFNGAFGEIDSLPGCSQVGVSHSVFMPEAFRRLGHGTKANEQRLGYMKNVLGYDYALCTVSAGNTAQLKVLVDNNWHAIDEFKSSKTGNTVQLWGKELTNE